MGLLVTPRPAIPTTMNEENIKNVKPPLPRRHGRPPKSRASDASNTLPRQSGKYPDCPKALGFPSSTAAPTVRRGFRIPGSNPAGGVGVAEKRPGLGRVQGSFLHPRPGGSSFDLFWHLVTFFLPFIFSLGGAFGDSGWVYRDDLRARLRVTGMGRGEFGMSTH